MSLLSYFSEWAVIFPLKRWLSCEEVSFLDLASLSSKLHDFAFSIILHQYSHQVSRWSLNSDAIWNFMFNFRSNKYEDLSVKAKSRFDASLRTLSQPMSLKEIARTWGVCAHDVISEYAQQMGGGSFTSKFGSWENCLSAAWYVRKLIISLLRTV